MCRLNKKTKKVLILVVMEDALALDFAKLAEEKSLHLS